MPQLAPHSVIMIYCVCSLLLLMLVISFFYLARVISPVPMKSIKKRYSINYY